MSKWSQTPPSKTGWYWARQIGSPEKVEALRVYESTIEQDRFNCGLITYIGALCLTIDCGMTDWEWYQDELRPPE